MLDIFKFRILQLIDLEIDVFANRYRGKLCLEPIFIDKDPLVGYEKSIRQLRCVGKIIEGRSCTGKIVEVDIKPKDDLTSDGRRKICIHIEIEEIIGKRYLGHYREGNALHLRSNYFTSRRVIMEKYRREKEEVVHGEKEVQETHEKQPSKQEAIFSTGRSIGYGLITTGDQAA